MWKSEIELRTDQSVERPVDSLARRLQARQIFEGEKEAAQNGQKLRHESKGG
jgi:hypothetical protein